MIGSIDGAIASRMRENVERGNWNPMDGAIKRQETIRKRKRCVEKFGPTFKRLLKINEEGGEIARRR